MSETLASTDNGTIIAMSENKLSLIEIFLLFFKIGSLAFGGFMALISVIENAVVKQRKLLSHQDMLDGIALANLLPGPMAVNVVAFTGYKLHGKLGALVATIGVIIPSFVLILILSYLYFNYGEITNFSSVFKGFIPAIAAIVVSVVWRLGKKNIVGPIEFLLFIIATSVLLIVPIQYKIYAPITLILAGGFLGYILFKDNKETTAKEIISKSEISVRKLFLTLAFFASLVAIWFFPLPFDKNSLLYLTLTFASMSLMLFGGGYVFIPIIGSIVVLENGWLTQQQFLDGIALGQVTPGPILISATFIGYKVSGIWGAICSTIAIFSVPAILMVAASQWLEVIQRSPSILAAMKGIHCVVIGMIFVAAIVILQSAIPSDTFYLSTIWPGLLIFCSALVALFRFNLDVIWIIPPAGFLGYLFF